MDKKQFFKFYKILRGGDKEENLAKITDHVFRCFDQNLNGTLDFSGKLSATQFLHTVQKANFFLLFRFFK
jgi:hypothetical protein